jgi:hypothetical protein
MIWETIEQEFFEMLGNRNPLSHDEVWDCLMTGFEWLLAYKNNIQTTDIFSSHFLLFQKRWLTIAFKHYIHSPIDFISLTPMFCSILKTWKEEEEPSIPKTMHLLDKMCSSFLLAKQDNQP